MQVSVSRTCGGLAQLVFAGETAVPRQTLPQLLHEDLIDVTPQPVFARLEGLDDRVLGSVEMLRRVFVLRTVAAADMTASFAEAKMNPRVAHFQAFFTTPC
jgi:hypothetical protein